MNYSINMNKKYSGTFTALVTPFKKDGSIDIDSLKNLVNFQIKNGINGLVPCGSTGEAATMTPEEMSLVIKTVVTETKNSVPVIAGAGSNDTSKAISFSQNAKKAGADALLHVTPFYNKPTLTGLIAHFKSIANAVDLPIFLYNVPGRTGSNITADMVIKIITEVPQVIGIKEASGSITQIMDLIKKAPPEFIVLSGDDTLTYPIMTLGGRGVISVASNEIPRKMTDITSSALSGDWETAKKIHYEWLDLMNINFIESNPQPVKTALSMMGMTQEVFRLPLVNMENKNRELLKKILLKHNLIK